MRAVVIYYSETGNTWKLAEAVAAGMGCQAKSLVEMPPAGLADYDSVCFCSPVQGLGPAPKMLEYIKKLKPVIDKKAATAFTKHLLGAGSAASRMKRELESKGYAVNGTYSCYGWSRLVANFGPRVFMRGHPDMDELEQAAAFGKKFLDG